MSCTVCRGILGEFCVVVSDYKMHDKCKIRLSQCGLCLKYLYDSDLGKCLFCGKIKVHSCSLCKKATMNGHIINGNIICDDCEKNHDKHKTSDSIKCYKCESPKVYKTIIGYFGKSCQEYEYDITVCPKCDS